MRFGAFLKIQNLSISEKSLRSMMPYCFVEHPYPGVPKISLHDIHPHQELKINELTVIPLQVMHDKLPILGYKIGRLAYITDMKTIPEGEIDYLQDIDYLVVNALRFTMPHHSHMLVDEALDWTFVPGSANPAGLEGCIVVGGPFHGCIIELFVKCGAVNINVGMLLLKHLKSLRCCDKAHKYNLTRVAKLNLGNCVNCRAACCKHRVNNINITLFDILW